VACALSETNRDWLDTMLGPNATVTVDAAEDHHGRLPAAGSREASALGMFNDLSQGFARCCRRGPIRADKCQSSTPRTPVK
jgi:hypothetical protein